MEQSTANLLTQTNAGTPMGDLMRRYWVPILGSSEIKEPDSAPVRVKILGEKLLAFRDSEGVAALISEFCTHRGVSLFFGRNEECGIRCSYHGLKFDRTGACVDVPSAQGQQQVMERMRIKAYPCIERGGVVWAYMGPADMQPEPPALEWCTLPASHVFVTRRLQESNYLQAIEGGIDTAHVSFVHKFEVDTDPMHKGAKAIDYIKADGNVVFDIEKSAHGLTLYGRRKGDAANPVTGAPETDYWRITQFIFPWFTLIPPFGDHSLGGHVWVPADDENCWAWSINYRPDQALSEHEISEMQAGYGIHVKYETPPVGQPMTWRPYKNKDNDYLIDRQAQKDRRSYSGIFGFSEQDASLQESMGAIQDRTTERLLSTDKGIVMARRMLQDAAEGLQQGKEPPALDPKSHAVRSAGVMLPKGQDPKPWAKDKLENVAGKPIYSI
jgi:phthalate 4,5-dioxygenase